MCKVFVQIECQVSLLDIEYYYFDRFKKIQSCKYKTDISAPEQQILKMHMMHKELRIFILQVYCVFCVVW